MENLKGNGMVLERSSGEVGVRFGSGLKDFRTSLEQLWKNFEMK